MPTVRMLASGLTMSSSSRGPNKLTNQASGDRAAVASLVAFGPASGPRLAIEANGPQQEER